MNLKRRAAAEFVGTFWLVFAGCGARYFQRLSLSLESDSSVLRLLLAYRPNHGVRPPGLFPDVI